VKRLGQAVAAVALVVGGCGVSAVEGHPIAPPVNASETARRQPSPSIPSGPPTTTAGSVPPPTTSQASLPESVVRAYFDAINAKDYQRAWALGGKNVGQPYEAFAAGFATTDRDELTVMSVQGSTVTAELAAHQTDGTVRKFRGVYTVTGDAITRFSVREIK
jgi:hypothetical protein